MPDRFVLQAPAARTALMRGMDLMTGLLRPTLGPTARTVAIARIIGQDPPEVLDNAATIARRTLQLEYPFEDMGGMIVRQLVWTVFEEAGDGTATAAVICQALMHEAARYIAAGGNPMLVKRGIERALPLAIEELERQARKINSPAAITRIAQPIVRDDKVAEMIGEIMDTVGAEGAVLVEDSSSTETGYEYMDGVRWDEGYFSHFLLREEQTEAYILNPRIFITDQHLDRAEQLVPVIEACLQAGERRLFVIASDIKDSALAVLILNRQKGVLEEAMAVKAPAIGTQQTHILEDLAVITGGRCFRRDSHDNTQDVMIHDLGTARQAWATRFAFGVLGGAGSKGAIRQRINEARAELKTVDQDDQYVVGKIKERIGKLMGAAARLRVGAPTKTDQADLKLRVEAAITSVRSALEDGVVPGGGAAYVACIPALEALANSGDLREAEAFGARALARALAEPMRAIAENAGLNPSPIVARARQQPAGTTFDVLRQEWGDAVKMGVIDPLPVVTAALKAGASAATMALTTDVLIRHKKPDLATNP